ncbi:MAG: peptidylprolyl isomerase [Rhizobacter sp.]|nr:peptidylprolyl isomerase [Rhizobacter sp.]
MTTLVKIDDEQIDVETFLRTLKLSGQYETLLEQMVRDKLTARDAKRQGMRVTEAEIQERADQFRRVRGLHRAADTNKYLDTLRVSLEEFEAFLIDSLYQEKMMARICSDEAVDTYFQLNSPRFEAIEASHIVVEGEGPAREMLSVLQDDPDSFEEMAREHSIADTRERGGHIGRLTRGSLRKDVEAKVFHAGAGELIGPFVSADRSVFEIFRVNARHPAQLDDDTRADVRRRLREDWLRARAQDHVIQTC